MDLTAARVQKKLTQAEMAKALGISRAAYTNIENGKRKPSVRIAKKIGSILDINWTALFDEKIA